MKKPAIAVLVLAALAFWPWLYFNKYILHIAVMVGIMATLALSVNLMLRIGQLSIAHASFMGLGAYGSALLMMRLQFPFVAAMLLAGLLVAALAMLLGPIFLRIKGVYFVLLTFAFGQVIDLIFQAWVEVFGGNNGLFGIPKASLFGYRLLDIRFYYLMAVGLAALTFYTVNRIYRSEMGVIMDSVEENEQLSESLGVDSLRYRITVFGISAFFAGLSGGLYAHYLGFLSPEAFSFWTLVNVLVMNVIGGISSPVGAVLGAVLLVPLPEILRDAKQYQVLFYGVLLIVFLLFLPSGLVGLFERRKAAGKT
jgi:branched-chain amino acid transport system permease protein